MSSEIEKISWTDWLRRQRDNPESTTGQLMAAGVPLETALLITMLGRLHEELIELNERFGRDDETESWKDRG